jgi:hypothetical protein
MSIEVYDARARTTGWYQPAVWHLRVVVRTLP